MASGPLANRESSSPLPSPISSPMGLLPLSDTESSHAWKLINLNFSCQSSQHQRYRTRTNICQARCWFLPSFASFFISWTLRNKCGAPNCSLIIGLPFPTLKLPENFVLIKTLFLCFFPLFFFIFNRNFSHEASPLFLFITSRNGGRPSISRCNLSQRLCATQQLFVVCVESRGSGWAHVCVCACVFVCSSSPNAFFSHSDAGWRMMVKLSLSAATIVEAPVSMWRLSYVDSACSSSKIAGRVWPLEAVMADTIPSDK